MQAIKRPGESRNATIKGSLGQPYIEQICAPCIDRLSERIAPLSHQNGCLPDRNR